MLTATAMAWGGMFPVMKPLLGDIDPITLTLVRFGFAVPVLIALLVIKEGLGTLSTSGKALQLWWLGTLGFAGFGLLLVLGLKSTRPEHAAVIPALMPLIAIVVASIRGRSWPSSRALTAVMAGIAGVCLVVTRGDPGMLLGGGAGHGEPTP
ncbi:EamA-like transporter family protein [Advenella incenata]|uniref:EamA-like transporter family protein n=1 Tax=Advenella incenata TaxID=267800 RepID=A0A4Q7VQ10_9BURK|nr:DMT family transporter [Advenella incenata]RZT98238.1 EamA-like transporter family protein [Advenella incenata]